MEMGTHTHTHTHITLTHTLTLTLIHIHKSTTRMMHFDKDDKLIEKQNVRILYEY